MHKLTFLINSLFTITIFFLPFQLCMILIDSLPLTVQCHAICPVSTVCKSKWRWRFTQRCKVFWYFLEWNCYFCRDSLSEHGSNYNRPYIFPGKRKLSFIRRPHDVYPRRYISPAFSIRVRNSATDISPLFILILTPDYLSLQPKQCILQRYNMIYYYIYNLLGDQQFFRTVVRFTAFILVS